MWKRIRYGIRLPKSACLFQAGLRAVIQIKLQYLITNIYDTNKQNYDTLTMCYFVKFKSINYLCAKVAQILFQVCHRLFYKFKSNYVYYAGIYKLGTNIIANYLLLNANTCHISHKKIN